MGPQLCERAQAGTRVRRAPHGEKAAERTGIPTPLGLRAGIFGGLPQPCQCTPLSPQPTFYVSSPSDKNPPDLVNRPRWNPRCPFANARSWRHHEQGCLAGALLPPLKSSNAFVSLRRASCPSRGEHSPRDSAPAPSPTSLTCSAGHGSRCCRVAGASSPCRNSGTRTG